MANKLNDTQLTILGNAASRDDRRILPLPKLKAPPVAVRKTLATLLADALIEEVPAGRDDEVWAHSETDGNTTLIITAAGLSAIGITDVPATSRDKAAKGRRRARKAGRGAKAAKKSPRARTGGNRESKQDVVIALLRRQQGATIDEMMAATDWQPHSVRGFMSGALKKRLGLELVSDKEKKTGERRYYIAAVKSK